MRRRAGKFLDEGHHIDFVAGVSALILLFSIFFMACAFVV